MLTQFILMNQRWVLWLPSSYKWRNWGTERLSDLHTTSKWLSQDLNQDHWRLNDVALRTGSTVQFLTWCRGPHKCYSKNEYPADGKLYFWLVIPPTGGTDLCLKQFSSTTCSNLLQVPLCFFIPPVSPQVLLSFSFCDLIIYPLFFLYPN